MTKRTKIALARTMMFADCSRRDLTLVAAVAVELTVPASHELATEGSRSREFCVIAEGAADVTVGGALTKALTAGDFFGESSTDAAACAPATITTTAPTRLLVILGRDFDRLLTQIPSIGNHSNAAALGPAEALSA